jgi:hypothetical protein
MDDLARAAMLNARQTYFPAPLTPVQARDSRFANTAALFQALAAAGEMLRPGSAKDLTN